MTDQQTTQEDLVLPVPIGSVEGWPIYMVSSDAEFEAVQNMNHICCFLVANGVMIDDKVTKTVPSYFKMMNTSFGRCVARVSGPEIGIDAKINAGVQINYPKIPWQMAERMDIFFREAFDKYGTEATVLLSYDMAKINHKDASKGWDFFVPKQENTSHACKYDLAEEVEANLDGTTKVLAGSAHSHPEMTAYFSHTDHKDQADFDGVHITYGWKKDAETEYHAEVIMGGIQWPYHPFALMEETPKPNFAYTALDSHLSQVSEKKTVTQTWPNQGGHGYTVGGSHSSSGGVKSPGGTVTSIGNSAPGLKGPIIHLPLGSPDVRTNTIILELQEDDKECGFCAAPLTDKAKDHRRCYACSSFFVMDDEEWDEINTVREKKNLAAIDLVSPEKAPRNIYVWSRDVQGANDFALVCKVDDGTPKK